MSARFLTHPLLEAGGIAHGFGVRGATAPTGCVRSRQVHGAEVVAAAECAGPEPPAADGIVSDTPGLPVAVVTADCVPILMAAPSGAAVAAIHAGWRGLAAGVVAAGVARLRDLAGGSALLAVIGPCIGPCCYEVDTPVLDALSLRFRGEIAAGAIPTRAGHARIDLGRLARAELLAAGLAPDAVAVLADACTRCDSDRFHSHRRDGSAAGRLVHFICARRAQA